MSTLSFLLKRDKCPAGLRKSMRGSPGSNYQKYPLEQLQEVQGFTPYCQGSLLLETRAALPRLLVKKVTFDA